MATIHEKIKARRLEKGLSMEQLAEQVGVSWQTVQQWEKSTAPKRKRLDLVAAELEVEPSYLLDDSQPVIELSTGGAKNSADQLPQAVSSLITTISNAARSGTLTNEQAAAFDALIKTTTGTK